VFQYHRCEDIAVESMPICIPSKDRSQFPECYCALLQLHRLHFPSLEVPMDWSTTKMKKLRIRKSSMLYHWLWEGKRAPETNARTQKRQQMKIEIIVHSVTPAVTVTRTPSHNISMSVIMDINIFLNVTMWSFVDIHQKFRVACRLHLQDRRMFFNPRREQHMPPIR
jgi:hypothetical protein